ncbi:hypothetical protein SK128_022087 [Halocaridina rubra]|uniref:Brix domain-containing protein n=1 Tax=Halocaridina rubra TaxID=373956 RepID=A0AAN8X7Z2_HALRR
MGKKNNRIIQRKSSKANLHTEEHVKEPHCIVTTRGNVSMDVRKLSRDVRRIIEPNTSVRLENTKHNAIRDFVAVSAQLDTTHLMLFTQTSVGIYMKLCRLPHGPTITFRILNYSRTRDVASKSKRQYTHGNQYLFSPCIMTNLQPNEGDLELQVTARMFLDMFPTITPKKASPNKIKRCCLLHYDEDKKQFDLRHYAIRIVPVEVCRGLKKLMGSKVPNLSKFKDVSDLITKSGMLSDSEAEDDPNARVTVPHLGKNKKKIGVPLKSSIRLHELGPRLTLEIYKIENGLLDGQVLYHSFIEKTDEEKIQLLQARRAKKKLRLKRKQEQEENIAEKKNKKLEHKKKCLEGMGMTEGEFNAIGKRKPKKSEFDNDVDADDEDDDAEYYRQEVGEEPDPDVFGKKRKSLIETGGPKPKKFKNIKDGKNSLPLERRKNKAKNFRKVPNKIKKHDTGGRKMKNLKNASKKMKYR